MGAYARRLRDRFNKRPGLGPGTPFQRGLRFYRRVAGDVLPPDITAADMGVFASLVLGNVAANTAPEDPKQQQRRAIGILVRNALQLIRDGAFKAPTTSAPS